MIIVINEYTGMSADKPRKELIVTAAAEELSEVEAGHGSIAYAIEDAKFYVYDEEFDEWVDTDGEVLDIVDSADDLSEM